MGLLALFFKSAGVKVILSAFQWKILILIGVITVINYIDRSAISFAIQPIENSLGINNVQFGLISAGFGMGYIIMSVGGGVIVDKFGTIGTWAIGAILWSVATILFSASQGFWSLFYLRILLGLTEGIHFPALLRTVMNWLPPKNRAHTISLCLSGVAFASILGGPLTTHLIEFFSWRIMFVVLGSLGIFWALGWLFLFRRHPHALFSTVGPSDTLLKRDIPWKKLACSLTLLTICFADIAFGWTLAFVMFWLPGYFSQVFHASTLSTGYLVLPPWICGAIFMLLGGWLSDKLKKHSRSIRGSRTNLMWLAMLLSGLCVLPMAFASNIYQSLIWMTLSVGCLYLLNGAAYAIVPEVFGPCAGVVQGIKGASFSIALIVSPSVTGWLVQTSGGFRTSFFFMAALSIFSALLMFLFQRPDKEVRSANSVLPSRGKA